MYFLQSYLNYKQALRICIHAGSVKLLSFYFESFQKKVCDSFILYVIHDKTSHFIHISFQIIFFALSIPLSACGIPPVFISTYHCSISFSVFKSFTYKSPLQLAAQHLIFRRDPDFPPNQIPSLSLPSIYLLFTSTILWISLKACS